jgi:glycosyltransferase involved in cell wall biosynthesis
MIEESPMPKASIVIPAYNAGAYIIKTLDSIVSQSLEDFECLVIDDGSTDNTAELVAAYHDARIRLIRQANSGGPASPRNQGVNQAKGEYIFMFDSDDIMLPDKLRVTVGALDAHPDVDIVFTNFQSINDAGELLNANYLQEYDTLWQLLPRSIHWSLAHYSMHLFASTLLALPVLHSGAEH